MGDRPEAWDRPGTSGTAVDEVPGLRVYARRWVFLLVVSLLSCSNAMVLGRALGRAGRGPNSSPSPSLFLLLEGNRPFF